MSDIQELQVSESLATTASLATSSSESSLDYRPTDGDVTLGAFELPAHSSPGLFDNPFIIIPSDSPPGVHKLSTLSLEPVEAVSATALSTTHSASGTGQVDIEQLVQVTESNYKMMVLKCENYRRALVECQESVKEGELNCSRLESSLQAIQVSVRDRSTVF